MRVLIINDKLICGGAEIYALNLKNILDGEGIETKLLCFDRDYEKNINKVEHKENIDNIKVGKMKLNKVIFNSILYYKIRKKIKNFNPDKIILNNIFYSPITQIKALKGYDVYQIVHDYSIVCPKSTCIKQNSDICRGYKMDNCLKKCKYHSSKITLMVKLLLIKIMQKFKKKYIRKFIAPSEKLNETLLDYGYDSVCINNPIEIKNKKMELSENKFTNKRFIYVGEISERKGIFEFLEVFLQYAKKNNLTIDIIGKANKIENKEKFENLCKNNKEINYLDYLPNQEVLLKVNEAYCLVVPSIWIENYPTTVLEAQVQKTLVIGSDRGGIPEILQNNRGYIFDIKNPVDISQTLEKVMNLSKKEYKQIVNNAYMYVSTNNSYDEYARRIKETLNIVR